MKTLPMCIALSLLGVAVALPAAEQAPATKVAAKPRSTEKAAAANKTAAADKPAAVDPNHVELDTTQITGNRELPRVLYVVPWKRADLGELSGKPVKSLLDEVLAPVDRDVFQRQNRYRDALRPDAAEPAKADATADPKVEPKVER